MILLGVTLVFSMLTRPILVVFLSIGVFLIGHWQESLAYFAKKGDASVIAVYWLTSHFLPDLEKVNWKDIVLYEQPIQEAAKIQAIGYSLAWFGFSVCLSALMFRRKDVG
jgi:ABC-type transport system involved in multi-copper enzyme maturation permease subunit